MNKVPLTPGIPGILTAELRELNGHDERRLTSSSCQSANDLVAALLVDPTGLTGDHGCVGAFSIADRDRMLAEIYRQNFGDVIESEIRCSGCSENMAVEFELSRLQEDLAGDPPLVPYDVNVDPETSQQFYVFRSDDGFRFRLPSCRDEALAAEALSGENEESAHRLLDACLLDKSVTDLSEAELENFEQLLSELCPVLDTEIATQCSECGASTDVHFDIRNYLLGTLINARRTLRREVHHLARCYGWSLDEILSLSRSDRREFASLAARELPRRRSGRL